MNAAPPLITGMHRAATVWLTGLPGAGKSSLARALSRRIGADAITLLDGDELRRTVSADLGFGREDRRESCRRAAALALTATRAGRLAIVALVSPYAEDRASARRAHELAGVAFVEVHVDTPLQECRRRDPKGLYSAASAGLVTGMTGVDDPYEVPTAPDLRLSPCALDVQAAAVLAVLGEGVAAVR